MSSTLAVRGPGFPEDPPKKVGSREHWYSYSWDFKIFI